MMIFARKPDGLKHVQGFSLMELVIVITITGILAAISGAVITRPMQGYISLTQRADLVDQAEMALRRMQRDIRRALPNSVRVTGNVIEMVQVVEAITYKEGVTTGSTTVEATELNFNIADTAFNTMGAFNIQAAVNNSTDIRLVIYNQLDIGPGSNIYNPGVGASVITPVGTGITIGAEVDDDGNGTNVRHPITVAGGHQFGFNSPQQRLYVVDTPITYVCDTTARTLTRFSGYSIQAAQPTNPLVAPLSSATNSSLVSTNLTGCNITYGAGATQRGALVVMSLTITSPDSNESITLMHQAHVDNVP